MAAWLREAGIVAAGTLVLSGGVTAVLLPAVPDAWRRPALPWLILLASAAAVAWIRRRGRLRR